MSMCRNKHEVCKSLASAVDDTYESFHHVTRGLAQSCSSDSVGVSRYLSQQTGVLVLELAYNF